MAVISLKVDSEFLDMDNAVIRITYTNNLFEEGAAPGVASYPFELPPTDHNLRILGQHNRLDNPESLLGTVPVSAFLYDDFYMDCLLTFQTIGQSIKVSLTPTLSKKYSEYSSKKLTELDFGQYNKFWIPECYRYSIGYFHFTDSDLLEFEVGDVLSPINYNQAWLGNPDDTIAALINQINADSATHLATAKYLKKEIAGTDYKFYVLIKGTQKFNPEPFTIQSISFGQYVEVLGNRNTYFTGRQSSNQAVHMLNVANPNFSDRSLYELAFGYIPWEFPVIYNEDFFGAPDASKYASNKYNYHINTYYGIGDKFLWNPVLGEDRNFARGYSPSCPQPHLSFVAKTAMANFGLNLETTFFNDAELAKLLMLNLYHQSKIDVEEITYQGPQYYELQKCMANMSIEELFVGIKKTFSQHFFYNFKQGKVLMLSSREILDSDDYFDLNPILLQGETIEPFEKYSNGFTVGYSFIDSDQYPGSEIKPINEYNLKSPVDFNSELSFADTWQGDLKLVKSTNKYWLLDDATGGWLFYSDNLNNEILGDGKINLVSELAPVLTMFNAPIRTGVTSSGSGESTTFANTIEATQYNIPKVKQMGNSPFHKFNGNTWQGRLMFYRGMDNENMSYPVAGYDSYWNIRVGPFLTEKFYTYSLKLTGETGTINRFHEPFIRNLSSIKKKVTKQALLDKNQILNFQIWKYYRVESQNMICGKMDVIFDNPKNCIRPAQFELYKK